METVRKWKIDSWLKCNVIKKEFIRNEWKSR